MKPSFHRDAPTAQAAVDIFQGVWKSAFPPDAGVEAGTVRSFDDNRIKWVDGQLGGLRKRSVLELGPYEGYITHSLQALLPVLPIQGRTSTELLRRKQSLCVPAREGRHPQIRRRIRTNRHHGPISSVKPQGRPDVVVSGSQTAPDLRSAPIGVRASRTHPTIAPAAGAREGRSTHHN